MLHNGDRLVTALRSGDRLVSLLMHDERQIYPYKAWTKRQLALRITDDGAERWYEVGLRLPCAVPGNAADGWDLFGALIRLQRSENLTAWATGEFVDCAGSPATNPDGSKTYWARSIYPVDSAVKSGQLRLKSGTYSGIPGEFSGDSRNNPITAITIAGVVLPLGGFPYTLGTAGEDARMQAALRVFYPLATVVAASNVAWEIIIPGVSLTSYQQSSSVSWPTYLVADMFGVVNTPVSGVSFSGEFVNAAGVRTNVFKQFFRY